MDPRGLTRRLGATVPLPPDLMPWCLGVAQPWLMGQSTAKLTVDGLGAGTSPPDCGSITPTLWSQEESHGH